MASGTVFTQGTFVLVGLGVAVIAAGLGGGQLAVLVAAFTRSQTMLSIQRKTGQVVIEAHLIEPASGVMAVVAGLSQFAPVNVVTAVATDTGAYWLVGFNFTGMTGQASGFSVFAEQGEIGVAGVVKPGGFPAFGVVAAVAVITVTAFVNIIHPVAIRAGGWCCCCRFGRRMAAAALGGGMGTVKGEVGLAVIKVAVDPAHAVMALVALAAVGVEVNIVAAMAADTLAWNVFITLIRVAGGALGVNMSPFQGKTGAVVIKGLL
jgi:hypothetical protein